MYDPENPMATAGPLTDFREGFNPATAARGLELQNPEYMILSSIDNGQMLNAVTGEMMAPKFGNCC